MSEKEDAKKMYEDGCKYKDIHKKLGISINTIKSWRTRDKWKRKTGASATKKVAPINKKVAPKKVAVADVENGDLNDRQREFCFLFLQCHNATQTYSKVYDVNYDTAMVNASRLLRNAKIKKYLDVLRKETSNDMYADLNDVVAFYLKVLGSDISSYIEMHSYPYNRKEFDYDEFKPVDIIDNDGNNVVDYYNTFSLKEPDKQDWTVIKSIHQGKDGLVIEPYDKMKAAKELINLLPQGKTSKQTDPVVKAVSDSMKNSVNNDDIEE